MKAIILTKGKIVGVDNEDFESLNQSKWWTHRGRNTFYAVRHVPGSGKIGKMEFMHRVVLEAPSGMQVDHIDGDGLNNSKSNLRLCSNARNVQARQRKRLIATSQFRGVSWNKDNLNWNAHIKTNKKKLHLGCFISEEDAARAYDKKARELFGGFASPNFPS